MSEVIKNRYWVGVLYPENMVDDWQDKIGDIVQLPFAYCIHDKDICSELEQRKTHVHLILVWANNTTYNNAFRVFSLLNKVGKVACNKIQPCISIRNSYDYLIHNTDSSRKLKKYRYKEKERICGNCFDIGAYEQISILEKTLVVKELCLIINDKKFHNFFDFYMYVCETFEEPVYFECLKTYSGLFERLTKGVYQKKEKGQIEW